MTRIVRIALVLIIGLGMVAINVEAVTLFHVDTFQSGGTDGWSGGASPTNIPGGGPGGASDAFLQITSTGGIGPGSNLATVNFDPLNWSGDFGTAGVHAITVDFMNPTTSPNLDMRMVLFDAFDGTRWTSTQASMVPNDGVWRSYRFFVSQSELTRVLGVGTYAALMSDVSSVMFRHNSGAPSAFGTPVVASLGIDNPRVVPQINCQVFDDLVTEIVAATHDPLWDLNRDGLVNRDDLDTLRALGGLVNLASGNPYQLGDANLDGTVDGSDFLIWNMNKFTQTAGWCAGDFNADGNVDGLDFIEWNANKFTSADGAAFVPEGNLSSAMVIAVFAMYRRLRSRSFSVPPR